MEPFRIFIVEDDLLYGEMIKYYLSLNPENEVYKFDNGLDCIKNLNLNPSLISLDFSLPDISGFEIIKRVREYNPDIPVVMVSGQEDVSIAIKLLKEGVYDYFVKNEDTKERLWNTVKNIREKLILQKELSELKGELSKKYQFKKIIKGNSPVIKDMFSLIEKATKTNITVSITGETGTGKELVAKAIHYNSGRSRFPFIPVNVTAIPRELIESEFFGYEKGAFTGAFARKPGKFEIADKGTIFLDEIGEMDLNMQAKLLRVIQEKEIIRVGGNKPIKFDARIIVATNKILSQEVHKGNFREDLYYRLLGLPIELPPLRFRGNDIIILARHFMDEFCKENRIPNMKISQDAQSKLLRYPYPGNVRELKAVVELACVMSNTDTIEAEHISFNSTDAKSDFLVEEDTLEGYIRKIVAFYLQKYNNNVLLVAKKLDIGKSTIYRMIKNKEV